VSPRVSLVVSVFNQIELTNAWLESLRATTEPCHLVVVDNGSTDGTRELFERFAYPFALTHDYYGVNTSVIASLNRGWRRATTEYVCLRHNDTELITPEWLSRLLRPFEDPRIGMTGLFGAKRVRRTANFSGRTIVHSLVEGPTVRMPWEVAVIDCVCMCLPRQLMEDIGGSTNRAASFTASTTIFRSPYAGAAGGAWWSTRRSISTAAARVPAISRLPLPAECRAREEDPSVSGRTSVSARRRSRGSSASGATGCPAMFALSASGSETRCARS
jgi:glycosyltransferase involved in cell wall biosynthesis